MLCARAVTITDSSRIKVDGRWRRRGDLGLEQGSVNMICFVPDSHASLWADAGMRYRYSTVRSRERDRIQEHGILMGTGTIQTIQIIQPTDPVSSICWPVATGYLT